MSESESCSVVSDSLRPHGLYSPWKSPGQNTGVGSLSLLQRVFPTQGSNPDLPHCRRILYQLSHRGSPCSVTNSCPTLCGPMDCSTPGCPVLHDLQSLRKLMSIKSAMPSNHLRFSAHFSFSLQSSPASGSFPMSCQSTGASASESIFPMNIQGWFPLGLTGWISLQSKGLLRDSLAPQLESINFSVLSFVYSWTLKFVCDY